MPDDLSPPSLKDSFAAAYLRRRQNIEPEQCFRIFEAKPDEFGFRRVEGLLAGSEFLFVQYYVVGTRETDPEVIGRIQRTETAFVAVGATARAEARHYDEIHFSAENGEITVQVKGVPTFSVPCAGADEVVSSLRKQLRELLRPRTSAPAAHADVELVTKAPTIFVDGANVARMATIWGSISGKGYGRVEPLIAVKKHLMKKGYFPLIVYDASLRNDSTMDVKRLDEEIAPRPPHFKSETTMEADSYILAAADTHEESQPLDKWFIVSNDAFRDHHRTFSGIDFDRRLVTVSWIGATPAFTIVGSRNYHHVDNPNAVNRRLLPRAGPPVDVQVGGPAK